MTATQKYFAVVVFIMRYKKVEKMKKYKVVPTFESEDETLKRDHSNESYWATLSCCGFLIFCKTNFGIFPYLNLSSGAFVN